MGHIYAEVNFRGNKGESKARTLVDTGATYIVLPPELADEVGVAKLSERLKLRLANGWEVETEVGAVIIEVKDRVVGATVAIVSGAEPLLGAEALEALGLKPNPETGELEPTRGYTIRA